MRHQRVLEDRKVLNDALARHLGLATDVLEVDDLPVQRPGDLEEAQERLDLPDESFFLDLLPDVRVDVRGEDVAGVRRLIDDHRQGAPLEQFREVEGLAELGERERLEVSGGGAAGQEVGALPQKLARRRPAQRESPAAELHQAADQGS